LADWASLAASSRLIGHSCSSSRSAVMVAFNCAISAFAPDAACRTASPVSRRACSNSSRSANTIIFKSRISARSRVAVSVSAIIGLF